MKLPIKMVGVGAGFGYEDSGPTHHTTEDVSIMRAVPNLEILSPCDNTSAKAFARTSCTTSQPVYVRLDRQFLPQVYPRDHNFSRGFCELTPGKGTVIIATGNMVHEALAIRKDLEPTGRDVGVLDLYRLKPVDQVALASSLAKYRRAVSIEEHLLDGGMGSIIAETILDQDIATRLKRIGLRDYVYAYGGRENIRKTCGIDRESIATEIKALY